MSAWSKRLNSALDGAREFAEAPSVSKVTGAASTATAATVHGAGKLKRGVTQEEAWESVTTTLDELTDVVVFQQTLIDELLQRLGRLEAALDDSSPADSHDR